MPTFSSFREQLFNLGASRLGNILSDYCKGGPLGFFDGQTVSGLNDDFIVFDMSSLNNDFSKMYAMQVMLTWLWDKYVKKNTSFQKHVVVDEAWLFMMHKYSAVFLSQIARRGAKQHFSYRSLAIVSGVSDRGRVGVLKPVRHQILSQDAKNRCGIINAIVWSLL
jgi:hypothetical protein